MLNLFVFHFHRLQFLYGIPFIFFPFEIVFLLKLHSDGLFINRKLNPFLISMQSLFRPFFHSIINLERLFYGSFRQGAKNI